MGHTYNKATALGYDMEGVSVVRGGHHNASPEDDKGKDHREYLPGLSSPAPSLSHPQSLSLVCPLQTICVKVTCQGGVELMP